jgi:hypothetical protein
MMTRHLAAPALAALLLLAASPALDAQSPTVLPTESPTTETESPSAVPVEASPTEEPTAETESPSAVPVEASPTEEPTAETESPTATPTEEPTTTPTDSPTAEPTAAPGPMPAIIGDCDFISTPPFSAFPYATECMDNCPACDPDQLFFNARCYCDDICEEENNCCCPECADLDEDGVEYFCASGTLSESPSAVPVEASPTEEPTAETESPSAVPEDSPTEEPTAETESPTATPTEFEFPTQSPTGSPAKR